jgi:hypothetical protein
MTHRLDFGASRPTTNMKESIAVTTARTSTAGAIGGRSMMT